MMAAVIPGMGVCKYCDATSVPRGCFGAEIDGGQCLGCGAPEYALLERKRPDAAMLTEDDATHDHYWDDCEMCGRMVVCGKCGNNCCNGGHGKLPDGTKCDACPSAYEMQARGEP